MFDVVPPECQL